MDVGKPRANLGRRLDERFAIFVMLLKAGRDRKDIGVEDDVLWRRSDPVHENFVGARADFDFALFGIGLALLVERHHHHGRAIAHHHACAFDKGVLAFLQRNRIGDRLALHAFKARLDHAPF